MIIHLRQEKSGQIRVDIFDSADGFKEEDHPRAPDGEFSAGAGGASSGGPTPTGITPTGGVVPTDQDKASEYHLPKEKQEEMINSIVTAIRSNPGYRLRQDLIRARVEAGLKPGDTVRRGINLMKYHGGLTVELIERRERPDRGITQKPFEVISRKTQEVLPGDLRAMLLKAAINANTPPPPKNP